MLIDRARAITRLVATLARLDPVPSRVSYFEPFSETIATIENADTATKFPISISGTRQFVDLIEIPEVVRELHRRWIVWALVRYAPSHVTNLHTGLCRLVSTLGVEAILFPFALDPLGIRDYWHEEVLPFLMSYPHSYRSSKRFLHFLCDQGLGNLTPNDSSFVRSFRGPPGNLYKSIESGEVFLSLSEQSAITRYLNELASAASKGEAIPADDLREAAVLICAKQHAMRPIQISKVLPNDVRIRTSSNLDGGASIHVRFNMAKQQSEQKKIPMLRKISSDWAPIFQLFHSRRLECDPSPIYRKYFLNRVMHDASLTPEYTASLYFRLTPYEVSQCVKIISKKILGHSRTCNDFRHTAAQRMVDAGASHEELAAFLGQSSIRTGNVYFTVSDSTVEHINNALGISPAFQRIEKQYRGTIDEAKLESGPPEKQVSGTIHGTPIPLIGECEIGIGLCPKHPVVGCYGCVKFAPIRRADRHEKVATVLRPVVREFFDISADAGGSSPYAQLRRTLETVEAVIHDLKEEK